jgi:hypothetical protein
MLFVITVWALAMPLAASAAEAPVSDAYLEGYVTAQIEESLTLEAYRVAVAEGVVDVEAVGLEPGGADRLRRAIESVPGVKQVRVRSVSELSPEPDEVHRPGVDLFPEQALFWGSLADNRWPRFSVGYQGYIADPELGNVAAVSFGESFPLIGGPAPFEGRWEFGIQGGVFSIFDLDSSSFDLINSDFVGGVTASYARGPFSTMLRFFHQSSHLGDEYLLRNRVERINLSFEEIEWLLGYELFDMFRLAIGGGYLVHREPAELAPGSFRTSVDFTSPWAFAGGHLRPIAAVDMQLLQENDWSPDWSLAAGLQLENPQVGRLRMRAVIEYYEGHSPNGQFYARQIEYVGFALRLGF